MIFFFAKKKLAFIFVLSEPGATDEVDCGYELVFYKIPVPLPHLSVHMAMLRPNFGETEHASGFG